MNIKLFAVLASAGLLMTAAAVTAATRSGSTLPSSGGSTSTSTSTPTVNITVTPGGVTDSKG